MIACLLALSLVTPASRVAPVQEADASTPPTQDVAVDDAAEDEDDEHLSSGTLSTLSFRNIGPALMSGRIADIAVDPTSPNTWYLAVGSGGVWKTTNAGTTWKPIFDGQSSYSIGCISLDPSNASTVWVGTGEAVGGRHVGFGDGIYRSRDGGGSFEKVGLEASEHIAKIVVDPRDSNVVYVAAQGPLWSSGGERGLFKTTDGGANWTNVLSAGPWTGVTDVVIDPRNPDVLLAATHQRHRTVAALINGGPESGIHKSTDGGATWRELKKGLPGEDKGKIALAISPQRPDVVYATIELSGGTGGFWRSENGGERFDKRSDYISGGTGPHYYQELWADPHRFDVLYQANVRLGRTEDGGKNWESVESENKHVDNHAVAFHPSDPDFVLAGCDGGLYRSNDFCASWSFFDNLPLTQFYKLDVDYDWPVYHVVGGTQDNNTQYGPTRTLTDNGIANRDWSITIGGDGHDNAIDPEDPNILYCESQQGFIQRFDRRTGESLSVRPQPGAGEENPTFNWDSPILISPHSHTRIYFASKRLWRSDDRGDSWTAISGDLSTGTNRLSLELMGKTWSVDAIWDFFAMSQYSNVTSISESPLVEGLIYVGTDDGLVQVTEDGGANWRRVESFDGVPAGAFVNDVKASLHDADTVFAAFDSHKTGDYAPYVAKSTDRGRTWTSIVSDLPERHLVWRLEQDHVDPNLLFLATEFGIFASVDAGGSWIELTGGLPTISFRDLAVQRRENDLVAASFGRGFFVLDDYTPLRNLDEATLEENELIVFPVRDALLYLPGDTLGGRSGSRGDSYWSADNPEFGAVFTIWMRDDLKTLKAERTKAEKELTKDDKPTTYPDHATLKEEAREEAPTVLLEIRDAAGTVVNRIEGPTSSGLHRVAWNLRYAGFSAGGGGGRGRFGGGGGPRVVPGEYSVQAFKRHRGETSPLGESVTFRVTPVGDPALPAQDRAATLAFQLEIGVFQDKLVATRRVLDEAVSDVQEIATLASNGRKLGLDVLAEARELEARLVEAQEALGGDPLPRQHGHVGSPSIISRVQGSLFGTLGQTYGPTATHREQVEIARTEFAALEPKLRTLLEIDVTELKAKANAAGAPWTSGRRIPGSQD